MHTLTPPVTPGVLGIDIGGTKVALRIEPAHPGAPTTAGGTVQIGVPGDGGVPGGAGVGVGVGVDAPDRLGAPDGTASPVEATFRWAPSASATRDLDDLATHVAALRARWVGSVAAVGVAMPATLDAAGRVTTWPGRPSWTGLALADALRGLVPGATVACADDGDLAALAEAHAAGCPDLVYLGLGTGVGGGIVLDGRPCPRPGRGSAEIGHLVISAGGPPCTCGRQGCVQATASGPATLRRASRYRDGDVGARADGGSVAHTEVTFAELRAAWLAETGWAVRAVRESVQAAAVAVVGLTELLHPAMAVVGGGFADGLPGFAEAVDERARQLGRPGHPPAPVRAATLGGLSSLSGAILLARQPS
ncbi:ROK family protein [Frankia sp. AiPs1]|uniref:ROK family protein n=1 Tax=Frankia sp. AiPs1 TaxID=573493 RepID=UPI0020436820|nr:ROK family protein [Frankia sp. AiPs1]MCM3921970.1 ROK family protein [Frankia sp. AiPs1]